jgi:cysteine desulfurase
LPYACRPVDPVYLDHNATTPVHPAVRDAMLPWLGAQWGNASSGHAYGRRSAVALADARAQVAALVGANADEVVFTSGGTEADNLAIFGTELATPRIVMSAIEHPAVDAAVRHRGGEIATLGIDDQGRVDLDAAARTLAVPTGLLTVMLAHNETGVIQPLAELVAITRRTSPNVIVHSDAAQAVGKIDVDMRALGIDLLTIVGHKFYAPAGIGALVVRRGIALRPVSHGGGQERGLRSGTEPVALAVALGAACALAASDGAVERARQIELREHLWSLLAAGIPGSVRTGADTPTLPNTLHVRIANASGASILADAPDVAASTGSACHAGTDTLPGALRLTLGRSTTRDDVERAARALVAAASRR